MDDFDEERLGDARVLAIAKAAVYQECRCVEACYAVLLVLDLNRLGGDVEYV